MLKRRTSLKRSRWGVSHGPSRRVKRKTDEEKAYTAWVHTRPCVGLEGLGEGYEGHVCRDRFGNLTSLVEQSHLRDRTGMGQKANDFLSVPMCGDLHRRWEEHKPPFWLWAKEDRRVWFMSRVIEQNAAYELTRGVTPAPANTKEST